MSTRSRRVKWQSTLPPPTPKIINLPGRHSTRRKKPRATVKKHPIPAGAGALQSYHCKGKLESLFGEEREFTRAPVVLLDSGERRGRVAEEDGGGSAEEKWRFQAEVLRAECNYLRMERKFALKKLERNRVQMEKTLKSALQNLASGRNKLFEGKNMEVVMEEEMKELVEKLEELQRSSNEVKDHELQKSMNFDKKSARFQRRLEKLRGLSDENFNNEIKDVCEAKLPIKSMDEVNELTSVLGCKSQTKCADVEILKKKMEGLSTGLLLDQIEEEYRSTLSTTANSSMASSASTSKRYEYLDHCSFSNRHSDPSKEGLKSSEKCSGRCKVLVRRMVEQVRAETEQWSQMQEMLGQLRHEMEELQTSKDFWETRARASTTEIESLNSNVQEWREKAIGFETKANELEKDLLLAKAELNKLKKDQMTEITSTPKKTTLLPLSKQLENEKKNVLLCRVKGNREDNSTDKGHYRQETIQKNKETHPISLGKQLAREKRILMCRLKENRTSEAKTNTNLVRSPLRDIGNSSSMRQNSNAIFPLHYLEPPKMEESC